MERVVGGGAGAGRVRRAARAHRVPRRVLPLRLLHQGHMQLHAELRRELSYSIVFIAHRSLSGVMEPYTYTPHK